MVFLEVVIKDQISKVNFRTAYGENERECFSNVRERLFRRIKVSQEIGNNGESITHKFIF